MDENSEQITSPSQEQISESVAGIDSEPGDMSVLDSHNEGIKCDPVASPIKQEPGNEDLDFAFKEKSNPFEAQSGSCDLEFGDASEERQSRKRAHEDSSCEEEPEICGDERDKQKYHNLAKLILMMDKYRPVIPDAVTDYYLSKSGFECNDIRVKRLLALTAQRFISNITEGAMQYYLVHTKSSDLKDKKGTSKGKAKVLEMRDLSLSLADHGINVKKQEYYL